MTLPIPKCYFCIKKKRTSSLEWVTLSHYFYHTHLIQPPLRKTYFLDWRKVCFCLPLGNFIIDR
ncbi:hypothetical protein RchiOBHm_Chr5g0039931 [Rosa chinensis]|uniref:Uncharacterized protein n=1 Tax=Rosa chinensis TaxID=74649 RepID=A0A2P6QCD9_ROSCH|nr:hypothetical protein RchiOBHm_Chr5g0039931 [Rosa chinensis]